MEYKKTKEMMRKDLEYDMDNRDNRVELANLPLLLVLVFVMNRIYVQWKCHIHAQSDAYPCNPTHF